MTFGLNLPAMNTGDKTLDAAFFALIAAIAFAASTVFSKRALKNVSFYMGTYLRFLISSILMLFIIIGFGEISSITQFNITPNANIFINCIFFRRVCDIPLLLRTKTNIRIPCGYLRACIPSFSSNF